jgi:hypothetical protein
MKKNKIKIIYSSHLSEEENGKFEDQVNSSIGVDHSIHLYPNFNEFSLPEVYNRAIEEHKSEDSILVFSHNDLAFDTPNWGKKLLLHFNNPNTDYQIIGVAGAVEIHEHGCWWQTASGTNMNVGKMVGIVNHFNGIRKWESRYSPKQYVGVKPVVLIDGVFMAVDPMEITTKFDESYKGFHMYDVSFCIPNYLDGCNVGVVTDIRVTHMSIGETNDEWDLNRQQFAEQYKADLPIIYEE